MAYIVNPADPTTPTNSQGATQGAEEFRALKGYIQSLAGLGGGVDLYRRNLLINGGMDVWQRGTSFVSIANAAYSADRFYYGKGGAVVHDIARSSSATPTIAEAGRYVGYTLRIDVTTADVAIAAGDRSNIGQKIEGYNFRRIAQQEFTFSFWIRAPLVGIYCASFRNSGQDKSYVAEFTVLQANVWERKSITVSASPSTGTWDYENGIGLDVSICLSCGTTFQTTPGAWQDGNFLATANQINATVAIGNAIRTWGWQIEAGPVASEFEDMKIGEILRECYRYYWTAIGTVDFPGLIRYVSYGGIAATVEKTIQFPVIMRALNVVSKVGTFAVTNCDQPAITASDRAGISVRVNVTAAGSFSWAPNSAEDGFTADGEL